jgi:hypothetical protein
MAGAANYMYEQSVENGVGYKKTETIIQTQIGLAGNKMTEKESGSGNVLDLKKVIEAERVNSPGGDCCIDYINFSKEAEFEYLPVSYQTGTYDDKWIEKLCMQNYYIGAVVVDMYTDAEHLQMNTEAKTRKDCQNNTANSCGNCTGALEANIRSNIIGVAHIGWLSKDTGINDKGRHDEYGRSVEDMTGVFSIDKLIQLWGNGSCGAVQVDWLPCV